MRPLVFNQLASVARISWCPCQYPERPIDADAAWHTNCPDCAVLADAQAHRSGRPLDRRIADIHAALSDGKVSPCKPGPWAGGPVSDGRNCPIVQVRSPWKRTPG